MRHINAFRNPQRGMSKWGFLTVLVIGASILTASLRLGPHYIDFQIVKGVVERLPQDVHNMSRNDIKEHFTKQFRVENFRIPLKDMMRIDRNKERTVLEIDYEVREHLFYNVDVVLNFREQHTYD